MIIANFNLTGKLWSFKVSGHANYGERGYDIVCAGVSALTIAIGNKLMIDKESLPELIMPESIEVSIGNEISYLSKQPDNSIEIICIKDTFANNLLLDTLIDSLRDIEELHPENISIVVDA